MESRITWIYGLRGSRTSSSCSAEASGSRISGSLHPSRPGYPELARQASKWDRPLVPTGDGEMSLYYVENYGTQSVKIRRGVLREEDSSLCRELSGWNRPDRPFPLLSSRLT